MLIEDNVEINQSLEEISEMFGKIYFSTQNYGKTGESLFLNLVKVVGNSTRHTVRNFSETETRKSMSKVFSWYFAVLNRYGLSPSNILWSKYPYACPRCLSSPCGCGGAVVKINQEFLSILALENEILKPKNIDGWQKMFREIYPPKINDHQEVHSKLKQDDVIARIYSRIFEELAEVSEAMGLDEYCEKDKKSYLENELADVLAWIFSLLNNLGYYQDNERYVASEIVHEYFPNACRRCYGARCVCVKGDFAVELAEKGVVGLSHHDSLTDLANADALKIYTKSFKNTPYYCLSMDIDKFGDFNKEYGHHIGDEVLKNTAKQIKSAFSSFGLSGAVFRNGGEEFVVLVKTSDADTAYMVAESIRRSVQDSMVKVNNENLEMNVTVSIGVVKHDPDSLVDAIKEADSFMQEAKKSGRNTIRPKHNDMKSVLQKLVALVVTGDQAI